MKADDFSKGLWDIANLITSFAVAQAVATAFALGKDLAGLLEMPIPVKVAIAFVAYLFGGLYCLAVKRCWDLSRSIDHNLQHNTIWMHVTIGRVICILLFTSLVVLGIFAPDLCRIAGVKQTEPVTSSMQQTHPPGPP